MFKYRDYYYSTGRKDFPICLTVEEALKTTPAQVPDVTQLQKDLLDSFPIDLWRYYSKNVNSMYGGCGLQEVVNCIVIVCKFTNSSYCFVKLAGFFVSTYGGHYVSNLGKYII